MATQEQLRRWKDLAVAASRNAYCDYSGFAVGAVVITDSGDEFAGCNVENASYGLALCAERNAIGQMIARGQRQIATVVIFTPTKCPTAPCGACRQVIKEFGHQAEVIALCNSELRLEMQIDSLLPAAFGREQLDDGDA